MTELERAELLQGTLDMLILKALAVGPMHGWGIAVRLRQLSGEVLQVQQGSLYPAVHRLERQGWIASSWGSSENNRRARFYALTAAGRERLAEQAETWERLAAAVSQVLATP
jgi:transcriptional regulator